MSVVDRRLSLLLAMLALLLGCGGEGGDVDATVQVDQVHDLVARLREVHAPEGSPYHRRAVASLSPDDTRDGVLYLHGTSGAPLTWEQLRTNGPTTLSLGIGSSTVSADAPPLHDEVLFRVSVASRPAGAAGSPGTPPGATPSPPSDAPYETVFERRVTPNQLRRLPSRFLHVDIELPGDGDLLRTIQLSVDASGEERPTWPAWNAPVVRSAGRTLPLSEHPVVVTEIHEDLIGTWRAAQVLVEDPARPVTGSFFDADVDSSLAGGRRAILRTAAPARIEYALRPPAGSSLDFAIGMDAEEGWHKPGDGMTFAVEIDGQRVWSHRLEPQEKRRDRGWQEVSLPLERWAGQRISLALVTETGPDPGHDVGGFGNLRMLARRQVPRRPASRGPNVIVVVVDTLRADVLGRFGGTATTPVLDAQAAAGVDFSSARAASSWTWPSTASLLTGLYPNAHGVHDERRCYLVDEVETLAEVFARAGYSTGAFVANVLISTENNFQQGFETYVNVPYANARALNGRVSDWLDATDGTARLLYLHYFDPHSPYHAPDDAAAEADPIQAAAMQRLLDLEDLADVDPDDAERYLGFLRERYAAEVEYFDRAYAELLEQLGGHGVLDDALIVFTSDHGEEFFEHGMMLHGPHLYDETVRVPLWLTGYGRSALDPARVERPVETRAVLATVCERAGVEAPAALRGTATLLDGRLGPSFTHTWHGHEPGVKGWTEKLAVVGEGHKLVFSPASRRAELYALDDDPGETRDLSAEQADRADRLLRLLMDWNAQTLRAAPDSAVGESDLIAEWMAELGYTGDGDGGHR